MKIICVSFGIQAPRVCKKSGEAKNPSRLKSSVKFSHSAMICGAVSSAGVGPQCFIKSRVNAAIYLETFRAHHASICWQALWRCWFPDLIPTGNLLAIVKRWDTRHNNTHELKAAIRGTWAFITPQQSHRLIASVPRRIDGVIHVKALTKLWVHKRTYFYERPHFCISFYSTWSHVIFSLWEWIFDSWAVNGSKGRKSLDIYYFMCYEPKIDEGFTFRIKKNKNKIWNS